MCEPSTTSAQNQDTVAPHHAHPHLPKLGQSAWYFSQPPQLDPQGDSCTPSWLSATSTTRWPLLATDGTLAVVSDQVQAELGELRGMVTVLRDAVAAIATRIEGRAEDRVAQRRYVLTTTIAAGGIVLTALGLIGGLLLATA